MKKLLLTLSFVLCTVISAQAQRVTDKLDRGVVAVPMNAGGYLVTWRRYGSEYYDTQYNLYRNGKQIAKEISTTNYQVTDGKASDTYQVEAVVRGTVQSKSGEVKAWSEQYLAVPMKPVVNRSGKEIANAVTNGDSNSKAGYALNDVSLADVDGDGVAEFIVKRNNESGNLLADDNKTDFNLYECYKMDGTRLWWIDLGPNLMAGPDEQWDLIGYDWDCDGKAECIMRGADNMIIHTASGKTINIGDMSYYAPRDEYTHQGKEYLLYLNGETGEPYGWDGESDSFTPMAYPLPRFEAGEAKNVDNATSAEYAAVWGSSDTGHRSSKHYFGAPYLDGRKASIFLGRGCYTRHKACALDVDPQTHELTLRWRWNCYVNGSPWYGNGFHNFAIADVDLDGRDEIVYGSMILDDTGYGLTTTGLGHGDAQHCGDLDPYRWGLEQFNCLEGSQGNSYWNATTGDIYYRKSDGGDDGRCMAGNFTNDIPGGQGRSVSSGIIGLSSDKVVVNDGDSKMAWGDLNNRIYWDGDLLDELMNSPGIQRSVKITKWGNGRLSFYNSGGLYTGTGILNNSSKNNPSAQGDILGDWREELVLRTSDNSALHVYTTNYPTNYSLYSLWHDHQYRNGMAWQCVGYNQPPHVSFFLGEIEGITVAPPPLMLDGRSEVLNGATIGTTADHLLISGYEDKTISVADGASPYILTVNTPAWVKGTGSQQADKSTPKQPARTVLTYTTTLTGGAFSGAMRLVKQGEGTLVLPNVVEKHTGETNVWNGTLCFDGTMESSPVWLNRHTTLITDGGRFMGGLKADYNATIYPGGDEKTGQLTVTDLVLGFGSRIVFDATDSSLDRVDATTLTIEAKTWDNGPKYKTPVFEFRNIDALGDGRYELGTVGEVKGSISNILVEGISGKRFELLYEDGKLVLKLETMRGPATVVWNGTAASNVWDLGQTENFLNDGKADFAAIGDDLIFDDTAANTKVVVKGAVSPNSITFNNETKAYTIDGDSILGGGTITKNGAGSVTINTENRTGETVINGGMMVVKALANKTGVTYGALGNASQRITVNDGGTLSFSAPVITDQPVNVSGEATIDVPAGYAVTFNQGFRGSDATVVKSGAGTLTTGVSGTYSKLIIKQGRVNSVASNNVDQLPANVEFLGGVLWGANMEDTPGITNRANFIVPEGKIGTFYGAFRGTYSGKLTGKGTFNVYTGGVRCYWDGDWSQFEGFIVPGKENRQNKKTYEPTFDFRNAKGLPKATLRLAESITFNSTVDMEIGNVVGTGTLAGSKKFIIGTNDNDIRATFKSTAPIVKRGAGNMQVTGIGNLSGSVTVEQGELQFNDTQLQSAFFGAVTLTKEGKIVGRGLLPSLVMESGTEMTPRSMSVATSPGIIKVTASAKINEGATLRMLIKNTTEGNTANPGYSQLNCRFLTLNGTVKVELLDGYTPKSGDTFTLWTASNTFTGTPTIDLPILPEGLYWDTSELVDKNGVLSITNDQQTGIGKIPAAAVIDCSIYTVGGAFVGTFEAPRADVRSAVGQLSLQPGLYIVRMQYGRNYESETVVVK